MSRFCEEGPNIKCRELRESEMMRNLFVGSWQSKMYLVECYTLFCVKEKNIQVLVCAN